MLNVQIPVLRWQLVTPIAERQFSTSIHFIVSMFYVFFDPSRSLLGCIKIKKNISDVFVDVQPDKACLVGEHPSQG